MRQQASSPEEPDRDSEPPDSDILPERFARWFAERDWHPRDHQLALLRHAIARKSALLVAPTGGGKTLAGFLPSLMELVQSDKRKRRGIHTLYISPLKALAVDVARNLCTPVKDMNLDISLETRTGDTPQSRRQRQRYAPPDILMTTPEQVALLLSHKDAGRMFSGLRNIVLDELHSLVTSKRGDLLSLGIARLRKLAPDAIEIGLSATVARPSELRAFLTPQNAGSDITRLAEVVNAGDGAPARIRILDSQERFPWSGHSARYALHDVYEAVKAHRTSLIFVNTRSQAEMIFQALWHLNEDNLPIALHHGSLDVSQRRKIEAAMVEGRLRAVVCTSTLDLGIDWGDVDQVINVGAPKGASRLAQRIGRANHRLDEPSNALLVPANRFEVLECRAALDAASEGAQDTPVARDGGLDVLAQHVLGMACSEPFVADDLFAEVKSAAPYADLPRQTFDRVVGFVATGGYALRAYERYARLRKTKEGRYRIAHPRVAQQYRLNVGTIVEAPMLKVRLGRARKAGTGPPRGGRILGEIEEMFIEQLVPGDTFIFAGEVLRFEALREMEVIASRSGDTEARVPSYMGGKFPLSTYLADRVRRMLADPSFWPRLPGQVAEWLEVQRWKSIIPKPDEMLVETFPRAKKHYLVCYPFEGRLAHQTLGMLLTRRLERAGARPLGFVASEYALAVWGLEDMSAMIGSDRLPLGKLFDEDMLGDDLDAWLAESALMKRTFRVCAVIAGLIERRHPGKEKSGRQVTVSSDLIYDVLREHEPDHVLLRAAWVDAGTGLLDIGRLGTFLKRIKGRIRHSVLDQVSPLAVPVMLEIGREPVHGEAREDLMREAADQLIEEAMRHEPAGETRA
ncbi:MAG: ligase-associated DNA damage response DEXH box helicase [Hyphomicrobiaceae bacterium]|nr:ligase-associated DNA damage response DEXH box helicase [Hyphomicrobiaceae bacterium]